MLELLERLGYQPQSCVLELTLACNLKCRHCGSYAGQPREDELTLTEYLGIADQLIDLGCQHVSLGGGEPTLHPHWPEIARRFSERGIQINLISNGWTWSKEDARKALDARLMNVVFSLDGFEEAHDVIRRKGSFKRVVEAIETSVACGLPASVITTLCKLNVGSLPDFREFLAKHNVSSWQLQLANPSGSMREHREDLLAPEDLLWLVPQLAELRSDRTKLPELFIADGVGYFGKYERALRSGADTLSFWIGCRAGCHVVGIESNGNVKGCLSLPSERHGNSTFVEGNLRQQSLRDIWRNPDAFSYNRKFEMSQLGGFCAVCRYGDICRGGCYWTSFSHSGCRDNPYCFYRQAVKQRRFDLLADDRPSVEELAASEACG
jgi:radical SAM protein with 4Fe4S-binding SPASM domain